MSTEFHQGLSILCLNVTDTSCPNRSHDFTEYVDVQEKKKYSIILYIILLLSTNTFLYKTFIFRITQTAMLS